MNNNYTPYNTNNSGNLPQPRSSGTIGQSEANNNSNYDGDEYYNNHPDYKKRKMEPTGYYYNSVQEPFPQSPLLPQHQQQYYNQPYPYGNMNIGYQGYNYNQSYYQDYNMNQPIIPQQYTPQYQTSNTYKNQNNINKLDNTITSKLVSYGDMYSDHKKSDNDKNHKTTNTNESTITKKRKYVRESSTKVKNASKDVTTVPMVPMVSKPLDLPEEQSNLEKGEVKDVTINKEFPDNGTKEKSSIPRDEKDEKYDNDDTDGSKETVVVPGTSITLISDEDIAKWREERKKMWLLKISNRKEEHRLAMGIKEDELNKMGNVLKESKKEKQFIQSIQNQVNRFNPKGNLNLKLVQREMESGNSKLLSFIKELGDAGFLEYELSEKEKSALFGSQDENGRFNNKKNDRFRNNNNNNRRSNYNKGNTNRNYRNYKNKGGH